MRDYPLISDYINAIKAAEDNFEQLKHLRPVLGADGNPVMSSGNFAVVFKMKDEISGKFYAVKCFLKEQEGREEAYRLISDELNAVNSPYLTPIRYLDKELFVDSRNTDDTEFPVLLMDWVEGTPLDKYIQVYVSRYQRAEKLDEVTDSQEKTAELIANAYELDKLSYQFSRLAVWLLKQPFAHGDLKPDNIMVKENGVIVLVDYDGMYVPAMKGQKARELGSPDFRHPLRTIDDFDEHIDDFPLSSILLSLLAIATRPALFDEFGDDGRLLFTENDYRNLAGSYVLDAIKPLIEDKNLTTYLSLFYLCSAQKSLFKESYHLFYLPEPIKPSYTVDENMSTEVTRTDFVHSWMDVYGYDETESYNDEEYGLLYDEDKRRLLRCSFQITLCTIIEGTKIICDHAFLDRNIVSVQIPESVMAIGKEAFCHCHSLESITIPEGVNMIGDYAFANCQKLATIHLPESLNVIGDDIFYNCNRLSGIYIPKGYISIYEELLPDYKSILIEEAESEDLITEVTEEDWANAWTDEYGVTYSKDDRLLLSAQDIYTREYTIREGTQIICDHAFDTCTSLRSIEIPNSVKAIGEASFMHCHCLISVLIPDSVKTIKDCAFSACYSLIAVSIQDGLTSIGGAVFSHCESLKIIYIPDSVTSFGNLIYDGYTSWNGDKASAFDGCDSLESIMIPKGKKIKFEKLLPDYIDKLVEQEEKPSTEVCSTDLNNVWIDDSGVKYSPDRKRLIRSSKDLKEYSILEGTNIICDVAFSEIIRRCVNPNYIGLTTITIPNSVTTIGDKVFSGCQNLVSIFIPIGTKKRFEELLPEYKDKLIEQEMGWTVKSTRTFDPEEIAAVRRAEVVASQYGNSVCFFMNGGGQTYIPLSKQSMLAVGDTLDLKTAKILTLVKGKDEITRIIE